MNSGESWNKMINDGSSIGKWSQLPRIISSKKSVIRSKIIDQSSSVYEWLMNKKISKTFQKNHQYLIVDHRVE